MRRRVETLTVQQVAELFYTLGALGFTAESLLDIAPVQLGVELDGGLDVGKVFERVDIVRMLRNSPGTETLKSVIEAVKGMS
jgi:hypothetical protein